MFRWIPYTFVRTVTFFISGILTAIYFTDVLPQSLAIVLLFVLVGLYFAVFALIKIRGNTVFNPGLIALPAMFLIGYIHLQYQTDSRDKNHLLHLNKPVEAYEIVISSYPQEKERSWKAEGKIIGVHSGAWEKVRGNIVLYFAKADFVSPFRYGDVLLIKGSPDLLQPPANPGEFDYKRFLTFRNIHHQDFLRAKEVVFLKSDPPHFLMHQATRAREWADITLRKFVPGQREHAIASALVLGITDGLDNELLNAYAATGAMHVLAVSGLHISIIYLILVWLLKPLNKTNSGKWMLAIISLLVLWAYAFVTGLSPSVLRAVTMFSFVAIARPWSQHTNIFNTLAASAFCLLLYDPYLIMSVGFQLSYLAVLGIVYLHPKLYTRYEANSWLMDEVWKVTCISIAAQLATFSLGLLYFHQFPNYFLLSNLLVIPISFAVLILGLALLALSFISFLAQLLGIVLAYTIKALNVIVFTVESFPFSLVEDIYITTFQCWVLMAILGMCLLMVEFKRFRYFAFACLLVGVFATAHWIHFSNEVLTEKLTVYKVSGHSAFELIGKSKAYSVIDSALINDKEKIRFHIRPNRLISGVNSIAPAEDFSFVTKIAGGKILHWKGKTILNLSDKNFVIPENSTIDLLIIGNNAISDFKKIPASSRIGKIVFDSSNSFYKVDKLRKQAMQYRFNIHSVLHEGAFTMIL